MLGLARMLAEKAYRDCRPEDEDIWGKWMGGMMFGLLRTPEEAIASSHRRAQELYAVSFRYFHLRDECPLRMGDWTWTRRLQG